MEEVVRILGSSPCTDVCKVPALDDPLHASRRSGLTEHAARRGAALANMEV